MQRNLHRLRVPRFSQWLCCVFSPIASATPRRRLDCSKSLRAPPRDAIGHASVAGTVGKSSNCVVPAKRKSGDAAVAHRPAAVARGEFEQRAGPGAFDIGGRGDICWVCIGGAAGRSTVGEDQSQKLTLRRGRRTSRARPVFACGSRHKPRPGSAGRQAEPVNFADDGVAADADLGGDLAAAQTCSDVGSELFDPFWGPGCGGHERPRCAAARSGPPGRRGPRATAATDGA